MRYLRTLPRLALEPLSWLNLISIIILLSVSTCSSCSGLAAESDTQR